MSFEQFPTSFYYGLTPTWWVRPISGTLITVSAYPVIVQAQ